MRDLTIQVSPKFHRDFEKLAKNITLRRGVEEIGDRISNVRAEPNFKT